jgi:MFS transporter, DHA1 family, inner membrane transport protein
MQKRNERLILLLLAAIQFTHILDFMIVMPMGPQFMKIFELSPRQFSLIVSIYAIGAFSVGFINAALIDRFDRKKALLFLYLAFAVGTLLCSQAGDYVSFLLARGLTGMFGGALGSLILSIVGDLIPLERRGTAMGWIMTAFSVASVVGVPAGIYLASEWSWRAPFLIVGGLSLLLLYPIHLFLPSMTKHLVEGIPQSGLQKFGAIFKDPNQRAALLFSLVLVTGHFTIVPFIAPYMQFNVGLRPKELSYIYLAGGLCSAICLPLFGKLADRYGHLQVFSIASIAALGSIWAVTHLSRVPIWLALGVTSSFFIVAGGRNVPALTMATAVVKPDNRGSFMSMRGSFNEMGLAISSLISGFIVTKHPEGYLLNFHQAGHFAIVMSVIALALAWRLKMVR